MATNAAQDASAASGATLCPTCSVIPFNDELIASHIVSQDSSEASTWHITAAGKYPLDYMVVDFLPTLPCLEQSALRGCDFCSLLRLEIMRAQFDYTGFVEITLMYRLGDDAFNGLGLAALVAELVWRPEIPSIPPASPRPKVLRDCIIFTLETDDSDVGSWLGIPRLRKADPLCQENVQFIRGELANCISNCDHYTADNFVPSRLLDLGPQTSLDSIHLIDSSQIVPDGDSEVPRYAALSYCWGSEVADDRTQQLCTRIDSLESMKQHMSAKAIPRTILDAIKVCKALSIHYLWVDSFCIVQNQREDWERESASMTLIYKNALVTICTPSSSTSTEGFLVRNRRCVQVLFQSRILPSIKSHYNLLASGTCRDRVLFGWPHLDIDDTSWNSRGWTLQEYEMSNRLLIFGESMVHFQCRHVVSENGHRSPHDRQPRMIDELIDAQSDCMDSYFWENMISNYGHRVFTFVADRLPAISGMAKYIADKTGDEYLAGLWRTKLPSSLVWHAWCHANTKYHVEFPELLEMLRSPRPYIAPSWSPVRLDVRVEDYLRITFEDYSEALAESTIVDACITPTGENPFGQIRDGRIRIRGQLTTLVSDLTELQCFQWLPRIWYTLDRGVITYFNLDWQPDGDSYQLKQLSLLLISSTEATNSPHITIHRVSHEAARDCLTNGLSLHKEGTESFSESNSSVFEGEADHSSDKAESESESSFSRALAVTQDFEQLDTRAHTDDLVEEDRLDESEADHSEDQSRGGSESRPGTPGVHNRTAFGLLLHPLSEPNVYVRVGVWASYPDDGGGTALFEGLDEREIDIV